jgi:hypothetical protein
MRCRRKFLRFFPTGFRDETYVAWEREYKWETHHRWEEALSRDEFRRLLRKREFTEIAARAVRVEQSARHSMLFSFEKMALRDAIRSDEGARIFATGLYDFLHGSASVDHIDAAVEIPAQDDDVMACLDGGLAEGLKIGLAIDQE